MTDKEYDNLLEKLATLATSYRKQAVIDNDDEYLTGKANGVEAASRLVEVLRVNGKL